MPFKVSMPDLQPTRYNLVKPHGNHTPDSMTKQYRLAMPIDHDQKTLEQH